MASRFTSLFEAMERVHIDEDKSLVARVTDWMFSEAGSCQVKVTYMHNGQNYSVWIEEWRLTKAGKEPNW
jgi:hypothetical protein